MPTSTRSLYAQQTVKTFLRQLMEDMNMTQEQLADEMNVSQPTIQAQLSYESDRNMPLYDLELAPEDFAVAVHRWFLRKRGYEVVPTKTAKGELNGTIIDELLTMDVHQGNIAKVVRDNPGKWSACKKDLEEIVKQANKAIKELEAMEDKK